VAVLGAQLSAAAAVFWLAVEEPTRRLSKRLGRWRPWRGVPRST
jgi:hypothetical protein